MGIYVNSGRNLRANDLLSQNDWFIVLGRCTFRGSEFQWPNEAVPPPEDTGDTVVNPDGWPDDDMEIPANLAVGIKRATRVALVEQNASGAITFGGLQWAETTGAQATHIYWRFEIEPGDFMSDGVGDDIIGYRRLSIRSGVVPLPGVDPSGPFRGLQTVNRGTLLFYSNQPVVNRATSERDVITIVLPQ